MGTQQILLLTLGVIIVGVAVAVGISMVINQGYISNKQALASEMASYPPSVIRFWRAAKILGGAGGDISQLTQTRVANYLGFTGASFSQKSDNGEFRVTGINGRIVSLKALGVEMRNQKHPFVTVDINIVTSAITTNISDATGF
jgi:hypothetical protein